MKLLTMSMGLASPSSSFFWMQSISTVRSTCERKSFTKVTMNCVRNKKPWFGSASGPSEIRRLCKSSTMQKSPQSTPRGEMKGRLGSRKPVKLSKVVHLERTMRKK